MKKVVFFLVGLLCYGSVAALTDTVRISSNTRVELNNALQYFIDSSRSLTINEVYDSTFISVQDEVLRLDLTDDNIWLKVRLKSELEEHANLILEFTDPSIYYIKLYQFREGSLRGQFESGTSTPQDNKAVRGYKNNFRIGLAPNESSELYFRVSSKTSITFSVFIEPETKAIQRYSIEQVLLGAYYGIILLLLIYSITLFLITRLRVFLSYGLYVLSLSLFTSVADGFFPYYFNTLHLLFQGYFDILFFVLSNVLGLIFMVDFLRIGKWNKTILKTIYSYVLGLVFVVAGLFIISKPAMFLTVQFLGLITLVLYIVIGAKAVRKKVQQSIYFLLAYCAFGVFILIFTLSLLRLLEFSVVVQYSIHIGYAFSMIILSYGLIKRLYTVYQKLINKEKEKKELIRQKNIELEETVKKRTAAITKKEINLRSILDNTDSSIWLVDKNINLIDFNRIFALLWKIAFGTEVDRGKSILELMPASEVRTMWKERYELALKGEKGVYVDNYKYQGQTKYFETRTFPIHENDRVTGVSVFSKDITEQLHAEKQLKTQNQMLRKVNKELDSFVYSASHDLKAPLASVLGLINLVKEEADMKTRLEYYSMMEKSVVRLDTFIKDIIDYSRNERTEVKFAEIDLRQMIEAIFADLKYLNAAQAINKEVTITGKSILISDPVRIRVALRNLISNAIKYGCPPGGKHQINITASIDEKNAKISIKDYGPGISKKHRPHIFEMFYRAHERSEGTGLGLYIVNETLERVNGKIELVSNSKEGCEFVLTIPNQS